LGAIASIVESGR